MLGIPGSGSIRVPLMKNDVVGHPSYESRSSSKYLCIRIKLLIKSYQLIKNLDPSRNMLVAKIELISLSKKSKPYSHLPLNFLSAQALRHANFLCTTR